MAWTLANRFNPPEPIGVLKPHRFEHQHWQRLGKAEGELEVGFDEHDRPVRIEYHWHRYFSQANPSMDDVYTAELWCRKVVGDWLYFLYPGQSTFHSVEHDALRPLLLQQLNIDLGS